MISTVGTLVIGVKHVRPRRAFVGGGIFSQTAAFVRSFVRALRQRAQLELAVRRSERPRSEVSRGRWGVWLALCMCRAWSWSWSCVVVVVVVVVAVVVVCGLWSCGSAMVVVVLGRCFVGSLSCCCHSTHMHMAYVMSRRVRRTIVAVAVVVEDSGGRGSKA